MSFKRIPAFLAAGVACLAAASVPSFAQQRRVEQLYTADGVRLDFPADGVWRVKARQVAETRARLLAQSGFRALNAQQAAVVGGVLQGTLTIPSFLLGFKDTDTTTLPKKAQYDSIFYTPVPKPGRAYTLKTFYEEMSNSVFHVAGQTYHWILGDNNSTYYLNPPACSTGPLSCSEGRARLRQLFVKSLTQYDATIDFAQFDNDGPDGTPNSGDDDGVVDLVQFVQSVRGAECSGPGYNAHHFSLSGLGGVYSTLDPGNGGGNITVNSYQLVAGVGGTTCVNDAQIMALGTSAHELGHGIGLPDLYDTNPSDADDSEGVGEFSLMSSGNYRSLNSPAHLDAWSLQRLGWVTVRQLTVNGTYSVGPVQKDVDTVFVIRPPGSNPRGEYYLLENKRAMQSDTSNMLYGPRPKIGGLLIWHVDSTKIAQGSASNQVNTGTIHGLALVQADGLNELSMASGSGGDRGDAGDPYPGTTNNTRFSYNSNPANQKNSDGTFAGFELDSLTRGVTDSSVTFKLSFGGPTIVRAVDTLAKVSVNGTKFGRFAQILRLDSVVTIGIDSEQVTGDSLRQYVFRSWSDGQGRTHNITATFQGDSISAAVSTRFRVRATASGAGTLVSYPAGNVAAGIYVLKDSVLSLKATPNSGKVFGGWAGDTTSSADSIMITVSKKYTVTAAFLDQLAGSAGTPAAPVMGKAYSHSLTATGGTGTYSWQVVSGALPDGLTLSAAGAISGIPAKTGSFSAMARVSSGSQTADVAVALTVTAPTLVTADVVSQILGTRSPLSADDLQYLDLLGNKTGGFDVGDFLAWVDTTGAQAPEIAAALAQLAPAGALTLPAAKGGVKR